MATFTARWPGVCVACEGVIKKGAEATYVSDSVRSGGSKELAHVHCPEQADDAPVEICGECYMALPLSGVCGECE